MLMVQGNSCPEEATRKTEMVPPANCISQKQRPRFQAKARAFRWANSGSGPSTGQASSAPGLANATAQPCTNEDLAVSLSRSKQQGTGLRALLQSEGTFPCRACHVFLQWPSGSSLHSVTLQSLCGVVVSPCGAASATREILECR